MRVCIWTSCLFALGASVRLGDEEEKRGCDPVSICLVTANAADGHVDGTYWKKTFGDANAYTPLVEKCQQQGQLLKEKKQPQVVVMSLQDYKGEDMPATIGEFQLKLTVKATQKTGKGHACASTMYGGGGATGALAGGGGAVLGAKVGVGLGLFGGPLGAAVGGVVGAGVGAIGGAVAGNKVGNEAAGEAGLSCGGVAVAVYAHPDVPVEFPGRGAVKIQEFTRTATTVKGAVVVKLIVKGQPVVVASTHGEEGIRSKSVGSQCKAGEINEKEQQRVQDFNNTLKLIQVLRQGGDIPAIWGGDFNPRTVIPSGPKAGCPYWPYLEQPDATPEVILRQLLDGREVLGADETGKLVTFNELAMEHGFKDMTENLKCPTYKKSKQKKDKKDKKKGGAAAQKKSEPIDLDDEEEPVAGQEQEDDGDSEVTKDKDGKELKQFACEDVVLTETGLQPQMMFYKPSHPPSWTDRIFATDKGAGGVLHCSHAARIAHDEDHDAAVITCKLQPGSCDLDDKATKGGGSAVNHVQRCCCEQEGSQQCSIMTNAPGTGKLVTGMFNMKTFNPYRFNEYFCPSGFKHMKEGDFDDNVCVSLGQMGGSESEEAE
eukprot:TRINITY_DN7708_c0_g1_i1.p1 TRINITY_DN7708_c0_g1~~TRINITY_DN7708_c0_g1_i1.p1  ORF type:complete len:601 (+),score=168.96 TRINITY_DN7708_c0_g1_i1:95-1897(+)